jgi:hypothetical protein
MLTLEDLHDKIRHKLDPDDLVELLQLSTDDLLDRFEDRIELYTHKLLEAIGYES